MRLMSDQRANAPVSGRRRQRAWTKPVWRTLRSMTSHPPPPAPVVFRQTFLFVGLWYALATMLAVAFAILGGALEAVIWTRLAPVIPFVTIALCLAPFIIAGVKHLAQWSETYTLTDEKIEVSAGILAKTTRNIPLSKVQDVTVEQTLAQRLLGLGDVIVDSASATGKITLRRVAQPQSVADQILRRAGVPLP
ncbi:MAG: hypothetical protein CFK52_10835 [Chloracidobacterium sp. CP2_5A]|nr:MAG: hypothetical protein CFK52_10835 [Chloracidobacterium sp. CP2_5A]